MYTQFLADTDTCLIDEYRSALESSGGLCVKGIRLEEIRSDFEQALAGEVLKSLAHQL